jgi:hypothetical protein
MVQCTYVRLARAEENVPEHDILNFARGGPGDRHSVGTTSLGVDFNLPAGRGCVERERSRDDRRDPGDCQLELWLGVRIAVDGAPCTTIGHTLHHWQGWDGMDETDER